MVATDKPARAKRAPKAKATPDDVVDGYPPPAHLDGGAATIWTEVVNAHHEPGRIVGPDLEAYCGQVAMQRDARKRVHDEGSIIADSRGTPIPHPAIELERKAQAEVRAWGDKFRGRPKREPAERRTR